MNIKQKPNQIWADTSFVKYNKVHCSVNSLLKHQHQYKLFDEKKIYIFILR